MCEVILPSQIWELSYRSSSEVAMIINEAFLLLKVKGYPVVETNHLVFFNLSNKHMLETRRVQITVKKINLHYNTFEIRLINHSRIDPFITG